MLLPTDYLNMLASVVDRQPEPQNGGSLAVRTQLALLKNKDVDQWVVMLDLAARLVPSRRP